MTQKIIRTYIGNGISHGQIVPTGFKPTSVYINNNFGGFSHNLIEKKPRHKKEDIWLKKQQRLPQANRK